MSQLIITSQAGVAGNGGFGTGVAVGDYDNDGYLDLYVTGFRANILYRNNGDGTFTDVTARAGVSGGGWSSSAGFFDYDRDGDLDLYTAGDHLAQRRKTNAVRRGGGSNTFAR